jgi:excisionase family DNA binding protein
MKQPPGPRTAKHDHDRDHDELWTVDDVATYCKVPKSSVYKWNTMGTGPAYFRLGRHARYRKSQVLKWIDEHID